MTKRAQLFFLELNELNFEFVSEYARRGKLPHLAALIDRVGYTETFSEQRYDEIEPWIQWVTAHTGLPLADHGVFRLGDITKTDLPQIWEELAARGLVVGAVSPMNAKCRSGDLAFFVPDPWTKTDLISRPVVRRMFEGISQAVADNSEANITTRSLANLAIGAAAVARPRHYLDYLRYVATARRRPWNKAIFLDLLLADLFVDEVRRHKPQFASLFLNAAAHIQHHYMFSSSAYRGEMRNPDWYVKSGADPLLDVYESYDRIIGDMLLAFPEARVMIATGLHQDPHPKVTYYWRLRNHREFLTKVGIPFVSVQPLMARDFMVNCHNESDANAAEIKLNSIVDQHGKPFFQVDNRGRDLFVMLIFPHEITEDTFYVIDNQRHSRFSDDVSFVAIKNGRHNGIGYFLDSSRHQSPQTDSFPLKDIPIRIKEALEVT